MYIHVVTATEITVAATEPTRRARDSTRAGWIWRHWDQADRQSLWAWASTRPYLRMNDRKRSRGRSRGKRR